MNKNLRLTDLNMTTRDAVMALAGGNPGALTVVMRLVSEGDKYDSDASMGGFANLLDLDMLGIYDSRIWMFYKDVCKQRLGVMCAVLRAVQLGFLAESALQYAIDNYGKGLNLEAIIAQVQERLPNFSVDGVATAPAPVATEVA